MLLCDASRDSAQNCCTLEGHLKMTLIKLLISAAAIAIPSTALVTPAQALQANASHLHGSTALPKNARVPSATYRLYLHVAGTPLTQLSIELPQGIKVSRRAVVTNEFN
jgi:hypothetical protein